MDDRQEVKTTQRRRLMDNSESRKRKAQKKIVAPDKDQDFISNLPEEIKCHILSYLPTRYAVQTSILSSRWRNTWASVPEISIREDDFALPLATTWKNRSRFIKFVDILLCLHTGPIWTFELETSGFSNIDDDYFQNGFNIWILHLSRRNELRKLSFIFSSEYRYKLPTSLFSCHGLSSLKLCECIISLPRGFQGFKSMRVLEFQGCIISSDDLEKFVSSCPILEELVMKRAMYNYVDFYYKIYAPKLQKLIIHGKLKSLILKTPCLIKACFELEVVPSGIHGRDNLVDALGSLSEAEILGLHKDFIEYLAAGGVPTHLPLKLNKLTMLALDVNLFVPQEAALTRLLLQNAPNLQEINLKSHIGSLTARLCKIGPGGLFMTLRLEDFSRLWEFFISETEIEFTQFILGSLPLFQQLALVRNTITDVQVKEAIVRMLKRIPKVSRNLQIKFV